MHGTLQGSNPDSKNVALSLGLVPCRPQALKIVKAMEAKTRGKGADDDLGAYATALIPAMPEPPYFFKVQIPA